MSQDAVARSSSLRDGTARRKTFRRETGKYVPKKFTPARQYRFLLDRRRSYLARISGPPSDDQIAMAQSLSMLEWAALQAERENTLQSLREAREHRRLLLKVIVDFERSLVQPGAKAADSALSNIHARFGAPRR